MGLPVGDHRDVGLFWLKLFLALLHCSQKGFLFNLAHGGVATLHLSQLILCVISCLFKLFEELGEVPHLNVTNLIPSVEHLRFWVEINPSNHIIVWLLFLTTWNLLFLIDLPTLKQDFVFQWMWVNCIEVQVSVGVSRNKAIMTCQEFADLHLRLGFSFLFSFPLVWRKVALGSV